MGDGTGADGSPWVGRNISFLCIKALRVYSAIPEMPVGMGSRMGYSGPTGPMPVLTCPPEDWWDPAWQKMQTPGVTVPERGIVEAPAQAG